MDENEKMIEAVKILNTEIKTATGVELARLMRNRDFLYRVLVSKIGLAEVLKMVGKY